MKRIRSVSVLGAGTMGAQIAAHIANAGFPALLLDLDSQTAREGLSKAKKLKPDPFFARDTDKLITVGGFDTDLNKISQSDWIIEAVVERIDVKQKLLSEVESYRSSDSIISSNTSGIPISDISDGFSKEFRRHWLGTHFFNPPRYLRLLEVIPTVDTDPNVTDAIVNFGCQRLGKGVVIAKDTPGFIGNRIGLFAVVQALRELVAGNFTIEEIDSITGPLLGRPRSATFRTLDIAGIDIFSAVTSDLTKRLNNKQEREEFSLPPLIEKMVERGWVGEKAGQGFYKKSFVKNKREILTLDHTTMEYGSKRPVQLPQLDVAQTMSDLPTRIKELFMGEDRIGEFLRETLTPTLIYTASIAPTIAHSIDDIDRAMRWGFGWELGPFELWDAIGITNVLGASGEKHEPELTRTIKKDPVSGNRQFRSGQVPPAGPELQILRQSKEANKVVKKNPGASLIDLGDGILGIEFHSKMNAIGADTIAMLQAGVEEAEKNFNGLVIGSDAPAFSAGANLALILLEAQEENWEEIDLMVRNFQTTVLGLRYADVPVIAAPAGLTLGGGCEITLHADQVQAAAETYMGQVEVGVGLVPAGCGTKELLVRFASKAPREAADMLPYVKSAFELIGFATVSTSGPHAKTLGLLNSNDRITMNREQLISDAKRAVLELAGAGYQPPSRRTDIPVGGADIRAALQLGVYLAQQGGYITDHDALIGNSLAAILAGGNIPHATKVSEQYLLDLERETFLSLCGQPKTQARITYTLQTGKTLRN